MQDVCGIGVCIKSAQGQHQEIRFLIIAALILSSTLIDLYAKGFTFYTVLPVFFFCCQGSN